MGSRARKSTGPKAGSITRRKGKHSPAQRKPPVASPPDFSEILGRFANAISLVATAASALDASQGSFTVEEMADTGEMIFSLGRGVSALRGVYNELDVAIVEAQP